MGRHRRIGSLYIVSNSPLPLAGPWGRPGYDFSLGGFGLSLGFLGSSWASRHQHIVLPQLRFISTNFISRYN